MFDGKETDYILKLVISNGDVILLSTSELVEGNVDGVTMVNFLNKIDIIRTTLSELQTSYKETHWDSQDVNKFLCDFTLQVINPMISYKAVGLSATIKNVFFRITLSEYEEVYSI